MSTLAVKGSGSNFKLGNGASPEVFTTVAEVRTIGDVGVSNDLIEVTHMQSAAKEFISGLADGVQFDITVNYIPANSQHNALVIAANAGTTKNFQYQLPSGAGSLTFTFSAVAMGWSLPASPNEALVATFRFKITGGVAGPS